MIINYRSKFGNQKLTTADGKFDSKLEYYRYQQLRLLERAGKISALERQKEFVLIDKSTYGNKIVYRADFAYKIGNEIVVEDCKSDATITPVYKLKKRLLAERYGLKIREIKKEDI